MAAGSGAVAGDLCGGRQVYVLEGGYRLEAVARAVETCLRVLLAEPPGHDAASTTEVRTDVRRLLQAAAALHGLG